MTPRTIAILALVGVNASWGISFPIVKMLNLQIDAAFDSGDTPDANALRLAAANGMIGLRFAIASLTLAIIAWPLFRKATRLAWVGGIVVGLFFWTGLVLQVIGLASIPSSRSGFLTSLTTVFTPIFVAILARQLPTARVLSSVALAILGVSILTGLIEIDGWHIQIAPDAHKAWKLGDTLTTLGAVFFTGQVLALDYYGKRVDSTSLTPGMFVSVSILSLITFIIVCSTNASLPIERWTPLLQSPSFMAGVAFLSVVCSLIAFVGMNRYQPFVTPTQASVIYSLEPVFVSLWSLFIPALLATAAGISMANEPITLHMLIGGVVILFANVCALSTPTPSTEK